MDERVRRLNNGLKMPAVGLGTYRAGPGREARQAVLWALQTGYRLIDTSLAYWNEPDVGAAVRESGVPREQIFVTTKLENDDHGYGETLRACERSLENLGTRFLDLYLIHWPVASLRGQTWRAMERLYEEGLCRAIGVSNYTVRHLEELLASSEVVPAVNQVEFHPFLYQRDLLEFCRERSIQLEAYSPLVKATRFDDPVLRRLGEKYSKTPAQILIRWDVEHGVVPIPKSVHREWIEENIDVWDFSLDVEDVRSLDALNREYHSDWDPTDMP